MGGTSKEEIERQHQEALRLIDEGLECLCCPKEASKNGGEEIPIKYKKYPVDRLPMCSSSEEKKAAECQEDNIPCWASRGTVDVTALQSLFREGYNGTGGDGTISVAPAGGNQTTKPSRRYRECDVKSTTDLWDDINASVHNSSITRPSHDAWGIKKVVLVFSDDFLQNTYELPFWHSREDIRQAVQPILDVLGIGDDPNRIARLLLASLPPGVTIPIHHDTGEWVKSTHRVHCPIFVANPNRVLFRSGLSSDSMERIDCTPGHVFELNNQVKHAVSNWDSDYRVHLIIDYFDKDYYNNDGDKDGKRIRLEPGEVLLQTRRSVDRLSYRGTRQTPSFLILGAQKAGTTSLYEYVNQHPLVVRAKRRETHCLDWRWNDSLKTADKQREWCHKFYFKDELDLHPSCLTGDSTPSYLLDSRRVIPHLKSVFNWKLKFFVMLRDPVRRAESHYAMSTSNHGTEAQLKTRGAEWRNRQIEEVVADDLKNMDRCGLIPYFNIETGVIDQSAFDEFSGSKKENDAWDRYLSDIPLNTGSYCLLGRGMYELNLRPWFKAFDRDVFLILQLEKLENGTIGSEMDKVWSHLEVPAIHLEDETPKNQRQYNSLLDDKMKSYLYRFFKPHNDRLARILGEEEWMNAWSTCSVPE